MSSKKRVFIYGGTFSPPHIGHVNVAKAIEREEKPDELLIIPTFISPHKEQCNDATPKQRLQMCRLAFSDISCARISDMEITRRGKSYTFDTISELYDESTELTLVCGTDMILSFDSWYRFGDIFKMTTIAYIRREKEDEISRQICEKVQEYCDKYNARVKEIKLDVIEMSSSEIREKIKGGEDVSFYLTDAVKDYIEERKIYCNE